MCSSRTAVSHFHLVWETYFLYDYFPLVGFRKELDPRDLGEEEEAALKLWLLFQSLGKPDVTLFLDLHSPTAQSGRRKIA